MLEEWKWATRDVQELQHLLKALEEGIGTNGVRDVLNYPTMKEA